MIFSDCIIENDADHRQRSYRVGIQLGICRNRFGPWWIGDLFGEILKMEQLGYISIPQRNPL